MKRRKNKNVGAYVIIVTKQYKGKLIITERKNKSCIVTIKDYRKWISSSKKSKNTRRDIKKRCSWKHGNNEWFDLSYYVKGVIKKK